MARHAAVATLTRVSGLFAMARIVQLPNTLQVIAAAGETNSAIGGHDREHGAARRSPRDALPSGLLSHPSRSWEVRDTDRGRAVNGRMAKSGPPFARWSQHEIEAGDLASRGIPLWLNWPESGDLNRVTVARQRRTLTGFAIMPRHPGRWAPLLKNRKRIWEVL